MLVKELIKVLSTLNPDAIVELGLTHWESSENGYTSFDVTEQRSLLSIGEYTYQGLSYLMLSGDPTPTDGTYTNTIKKVYP